MLNAAVKHLQKTDPVLRKIIRQVGPCRLKPRGGKHAFSTLAQAVIGQQISVKAAEKIHQRFLSACKATAADLKPQFVLQVETAALRAAGLSENKVRFICDLAEHFSDGRISERDLPKQTDEAIMETLTAVKGIGRWTVEMYLMFSLGRLDILPMGDLGFRKAFQKAYGFRREPAPRTIEKIAESWRPYRSIATWYLWAMIDGDSDTW